MALSRGELNDLVSRLIPEDLPEDPDISYRPGPDGTNSPEAARATRFPALAQERTHLSADRPQSRPRPDETFAPARDARSGPYQLMALIGEGGFGEVWAGKQASLRRLVAVKRLRDDHYEKCKDSSGRLRALEDIFRREAMTTARLNHPNIAPVHDLGEDAEGRPVLAMQLLRGREWYEDIWETRRLPFEEFLARHLPILVDVAQAVAYAHSKGIVHRDLKCSQVIIGEYGEVFLLDWGIAVVHDPALVEDWDSDDPLDLLAPTPDAAHNPAGTPSYMAPEQTARTAAGIGPWTDVYLLGGILYFLLAERAPHAAESSKESFALAVEGVVEPPSAVRPGVEIPPELEALCMTALRPDPKDRVPSAKEFVRELELYLTGSGRRRESEALAGEVERDLAEAVEGLDYDLLGGCGDRLARARALWPQNPLARRLADDVSERFARSALDNRDLVLARLMARRVEDAVRQEAMLREVEKAERLAARDRLQRRILAAAVAVLLLLLAGNGYLFYTGWLSGASRQSRAELTQLRAWRAQLTPEILREYSDRLGALLEREERLAALAAEAAPLPRLDAPADAVDEEALDEVRAGLRSLRSERAALAELFGPLMPGLEEPLLLFEANALAAGGEWGEAAAAYAAVAAEAPGSAWAPVGEALALLRAGRPAEAAARADAVIGKWESSDAPPVAALEQMRRIAGAVAERDG